jgi:hypothetical protein
MNTSQQSTQYTGMYNTFKAYIHGKDIDPSYSYDLNKEKEKGKTTEDFHPNETNKSTDKFSKSENIFMPNYLINSDDSNNNKKKYEMARNGPMQKITEVDKESEETFQNEEPKFYDEYDEQYVKYFFNLFFVLEKYYMLELQNFLCWWKNMGKCDLS